jgi:4'-phosphopantetheinyl transferase
VAGIGMSAMQTTNVSAKNERLSERWTSPPERVSLGCDDVHVWYLSSLTAASPAEYALLSRDECDAAHRFRFESDRVRYIACRSRLRSILAKYLDESAASLQLGRGRYGKPFLVGDPAACIRFNVSHAGDCGMIAIALGREVGVDIEMLDSTFEPNEIARGYFSTRETELVSRAPEDKRLEAFFRCWTLKEAWMKGTGVGLTEPMARFDVSSAMGCEDAVAMRSEETRAAWTLQSLSPAHSIVAAVAVEGSLKTLHCWTAG